MKKIKKMEKSLPSRYCAHCEASAPDGLAWRCGCGGAFEYEWRARFDPALIRKSVWSVWRYGEMLLPSAVPDWARVSLGEGMTPLVTTDWEGAPVSFKLEYLMPTSSYKDRGSATLLSVLRAEGHTHLVEDSSGNAGASIAAYASVAGIDATIFVPAHAAAGKKAQIGAFGAKLREIEGPRQATSDACHQAAQHTVYASHAWHPAFLLGQTSIAWELWEQTEGHLPDAIVAAVGQGSILLGYYRGFRALQEAALITHMPRLIAVQARPCAPLVAAWERGAEEVQPVEEQHTIASGIRVKAPVRGRELLRALRESNGFALAVEDHSIRQAHQKLAKAGLFVETTSAVPLAALPTVRKRLPQGSKIVIPLSGSGLKEAK